MKRRAKCRGLEMQLQMLLTWVKNIAAKNMHTIYSCLFRGGGWGGVNILADFLFFVPYLIRHSRFTFAGFHRRNVIRDACKAVGSLSESCFDIRFNPDVFSTGNNHTLIMLSPII